MDDIIRGSSSPTTLKRQLNHGSEQDTNGGSAGDSSPKRAKIFDDDRVTNHKAFPSAESVVLGSPGLNGAITEPSPPLVDTDPRHTQEPPSHKPPEGETTAASNAEGGVEKTDSGEMQTDKPATDSKDIVTNSVNSRTSPEEHEDASGKTEEPSSEKMEESSSGKTEESSSGKTDAASVHTEVKAEEKQEAVSSELANSEDAAKTNNCAGIPDSNGSAANGPSKTASLNSAPETDTVSSVKVRQTEDDPSRNRKTNPMDGLLGGVRSKAGSPSVSRRKDNRPVSLKELSNNGRNEEEEEEDDDMSMGEEESMAMGEAGSILRRKLAQRVTRSRTRKEMGIEDPPPKSIYAELSDDSDVDDSPPLSPWVDPLSKLTPELLGQREKSTKLLQEALRIEESKLLFLKKVNQNQQQPAPQPPAAPTHPPTNLSQNRLEPHKSMAPASSQLQQQHQQLNRARTTLSKQGYPVSNQAGTQPLHHHQQQQRQGMPMLIRGTGTQGGRPGQGGPPPLMLVPGKQNSHQATATAAPNRPQSGHQVTRPQPTVKQQIVQQRQGMANQQVAHQRTNAAPGDGQSAASRQAAAKLALRKQLEKTLLQIPPPKPPPPELHFLPSAANSEFIILVGLEEVVNTILKLEESKKTSDGSRDSPKFLTPYRCSQCKTHFTTIWKQDPRKGIMCEACIVSNQKRALKAEHTNRLKTAFVKALQQEQEIEQRMQQSQQSKPAPAHVVQQQPPRSMYNVTQQNIPSVRRVLNPPPVSQPQQQQQQRVHTSYQYIQHLHQGGAAGQIPMLTKQQMNSVYRMPTTDRQREYLLDMIPSKGLGQQTIVWKR